MITPLFDAIDEALARDDVDRALRLLIQNLPRYPRRPTLRRYVAEIANRCGRADDAVTVALHGHQLELRAGRLLDAVATLKFAESCGADASAQWDLMFDALEQATFGVLAGPPGEPAPDLEALRPQLERSALLAVALELGSRPGPAVPPTTMLHPAPLLGALPLPLLRRALLRLELHRVACGDPVVEAEGAAWVVSGTAACADGDAGPGALIPGAVAAPRAGQFGASVLQLSPESWRELVALDAFRAAWDGAQHRHELLAALHRAPAVVAMSPEGRASMLRGIELVCTDACVVVESGTRPPGLFIVTEGELRMQHPTGDHVVGVLARGDAFGDGSASERPPLPFDVVCDAPAAFAVLRVDLLRELLATEPAARQVLEASWHERHFIANRLDTSEVQLVDDAAPPT